MTDYRYLGTERDGATLVCTINNPPKNFLIAPIVTELTSLADEIAVDEAVRALIITGGVPGIFSTHYDVTELTALWDVMQRRPDSPSGDDLHAMHQLIFKLQALPIPVIAAVNGTAMGGGCELALGCDFRIKSTEGAFGLPEVRIGLLPGAGGTQRMARLIGVAKSLELMLLGNTVDGETAARLGLVHKAVAPDRVMPEALALAEELGKRPPLSIALIKQCVLKGSEMPIRDALAFEQEAFWETMRSADAGRLMREYLNSDLPLDQQ
ncbi:MAG: enoyl-CoA hydratase/isomerase family protein [Dehalococcoidia bacterium]